MKLSQLIREAQLVLEHDGDRDVFVCGDTADTRYIKVEVTETATCGSFYLLVDGDRLV